MFGIKTQTSNYMHNGESENRFLGVSAELVSATLLSHEEN